MRIFPEIVQRMVLPFSSSTLNMALGSGSTTVPSSSIASCLLNLLHLSLLMTEQLDSVLHAQVTVHGAWKTHRPQARSHSRNRVASHGPAVYTADPVLAGVCAPCFSVITGRAHWRPRPEGGMRTGRSSQCAQPSRNGPPSAHGPAAPLSRRYARPAANDHSSACGLGKAPGGRRPRARPRLTSARLPHAAGTKPQVADGPPRRPALS